MNICFVCSEYPPGPHGGIGTITQLLARALVQAGHGVRVVGVYSPDYPSSEYRDDHGVQLYCLPQQRRRFGWVLDRYRLFRRVANWSRAGLIDIVEVPDYQGWAAAWPQLPIPVVTRFSGSAAFLAREMGHPPDRVTFALERWSVKRSEARCSVSCYVAAATSRLFKLHQEACTILYNSVELPSTVPPFALRDRNSVVFTGTLTEKKGVVSLIDAWSSVSKGHPDVTLHIYGKDGKAENGRSMREFLRKRIPVGHGKTVRFHGHVDRPTLLDALSRARVAVYPSFVEAFGLAPVEAMASGCPTIFSRRAAGPEVIDDGKDGLLVDPDKCEDIARAIGRLLDDDELAARIGAAGRRKVEERYSMQAWLQANETFFARCVEEFRRQR